LTLLCSTISSGGWNIRFSANSTSTLVILKKLPYLRLG
jgi:hypothetical protein